MKTQILSILAVALLLTQIACNTDDDTPKDIDLSLKSQKIVEADNEFGLDIFKRIHDAETEKENFMISPLSISMALSMAYNGAETSTKDEMAEALFIDDFTREELNETYKRLIEELIAADPKVAMEIANSIWHHKTYHVEQSFLDVNTQYYNAEVKEADFFDANTVTLVNNWVSNKTHEKIPEIINEISPEMVMFLINAIYFKGSWAQEFNPEGTQKLYFTTQDGESIQTDMMGREDTLDYFSNETFSALELPYGDSKFNMMVMLPNHDKNIDDILSEMSYKNWEKWQNELKETNNIDIRLPKFKIEYDITLNDILKAMGMQEAFTTKADFSSINPQKDLFISEIKHKTFVEVNEEGTEAAAVTFIGFGTTSVDPTGPEKVYFHCDRPFLFAITEKDTDAILFMGKVGNPSVD